MSDPAVSIAFFDSASGLHGSLRSGVALLFAGDRPEVSDVSPLLARDGSGWRAELPGRAQLSLEPLCGPVKLGGARGWPCRVRGHAGDQPIECLGTVTETARPPAWKDLDATRWVSALFDSEHALLSLSRRPRGEPGHGRDQVVAWVLEGGDPVAVEEARVSTVYDGDGRQRSAGLELWLPGEDLPLRVAGRARAGVSLGLEGLRVHAAVFEWRMEGREGLGAYELTVRDEQGAA